MQKSKKVMIITLLVLIFIAIVMMVLINYFQIETIDNPQQNIATQIMTLPDGNQIVAQVALPEEDIGWIGANLTDLSTEIKNNLNFESTYGVYIQYTFIDSPAQIAGILPGDILIKINEIEAQSVIPALNIIANLKPDSVYPFTIFRQGKYQDFLVKVTKKAHYL